MVGCCSELGAGFRCGSFIKLSLGGGTFVFVSDFVGVSNCGVSSVGGSFVSPKGERKRSPGGVLLVPLLGAPVVPEAGSWAERKESAASSRLTTTLRVCVSLPLVSRGASSSNAVWRTALSTRTEVVCGRVNRKGFPDGAYDDEFNDVEVEGLSGVDVELEDDCVDREVASARSLRHFNSEAALAFDTHTAIASRASVLNRKRHSDSPLLAPCSQLLLVRRKLGRVVRRFLRNSDVMGMVLPHTGRGDLDESCFRA